MASNTRQQCQRELQFAIGNVNEAGNKLERVRVIYDELHPEVSHPIATIQEILLEVIREIELVKKVF